MTISVLLGARFAHAEGDSLAPPSEMVEPGSPPEQFAEDGKFHWDAPADECPTEAEVVADVWAELERVSGDLATEHEPRRATVIARARRDDDGWSLRIWTVTAGGSTSGRSVAGESCREVAEAAVVLAVMAYDSWRDDDEELASVDPSEDPPSDPSPSTAAVEQPRESEPDPVTSARGDDEAAARPFLLGTQLAGGFTYGNTSRFGAALRFVFALQWTRARFEVAGQYSPPRKILADESYGVVMQYVLGVMRGCGMLHHRPSRLEFPLCLGVDLGAVHVAGLARDEDRRLSAWKPSLAAVVSPALVWAPLKHLALRVTPELGINILSSEFEIYERGAAKEERALWQSDIVDVKVLAGIEVRF